MSTENNKNRNQRGMVLPPLVSNITYRDIIPDLPSEAETEEQKLKSLHDLAEIREMHQGKIVIEEVDSERYSISVDFPNFNKNFTFFRNYTENGILDLDFVNEMFELYKEISLLSEEDIRPILNRRKTYQPLVKMPETPTETARNPNEVDILDLIDEYEEKLPLHEQPTEPYKHSLDQTGPEPPEDLYFPVERKIDEPEVDVEEIEPEKFSFSMGLSTNRRIVRSEVRLAWREVLGEEKIKDLFSGLTPRLSNPTKTGKYIISFVPEVNDPELESKVNILVQSLKERLK